MTLNMIGAARIPHVIAPLVRLADRRPADAPGYETLSEQKAVDDTPLSLAQPRDLQIVDESRSLAVLRFKSHLRLKQTDDGAIEIKFKSRLKFNYEFQSEDGTTISHPFYVGSDTRLSAEEILEAADAEAQQYAEEGAIAYEVGNITAAWWVSAY